jgi:hypothetical protein
MTTWVAFRASERVIAGYAVAYGSKGRRGSCNGGKNGHLEV